MPAIAGAALLFVAFQCAVAVSVLLFSHRFRTLRWGVDYDEGTEAFSARDPAIDVEDEDDRFSIA